MKRRLFVAVPVPESAKREIGYALDRIDPSAFSSARTVPEDEWHATLLFLGERDETELPKIRQAIERAARERAGTGITAAFARIAADVPHGPPRVAWVEGEPGASAEFGRLQDALVRSLRSLGVRAAPDFRTFTLHITLARFGRGAPSDGPNIDEPLDVAFAAPSLDLMESFLDRPRGARYAKLFSAPLI